MNTAYQQAANNAAELERAYKFTQAGTMWLAAYEYASDKNREYWANRAFFCKKFGLKLEVDNGLHQADVIPRLTKKLLSNSPNRFLFNGDGDPYELVNSDIPAYSGSDFDEAPFEPCNNPSDAWAIITENRIMINPYCADELWKCEAMCSSDGFMTTYATAYDKNPLRAAMIAFLMMKEKENARDN